MHRVRTAVLENRLTSSVITEQGRRLHDVMVSWLCSRGLSNLWLSTMPNTRAQHFYESAGWLFKRSLPGGESLYEFPVRNARRSAA